MNVLTYSCGHMLYSDNTTVVSKLNKHFKFDKVISVESNLNIDRYGQEWERQDKNLRLINYHKEVNRFRFGDVDLYNMPPLSRNIIEKLSLDRCHLYNMHRDEKLTFRQLDAEIMNCFQYWNYIIDKYDIELFICHGFPHAIYTYSLYAVCKVRAVKVLYIARSCVPGYTYCHDDLYTNFGKLETAYKAALEAGGPYTFSDYMQDNYIDPMEKDSYKWVVSEKKESGSGQIHTEEKREMLKNLYRVDHWSEYAGKIFRRLRREHERKSIPKKTERYYRSLSGKADYSKRYIYVPLQQQPESTTSPMGNIFVDFVLMVKILAHCARDAGIELYVKEHRDQKKVLRLSRRKLYDNLRAIPGVRLIDMEESTFKLQENCVVTATCSGTVVMESMFKEKPVLVFGNRLHNLAPSSLVVSDTESCSAALNDILSGRFSFGKKEREAFLYAIERACFRGCWFVKYSPDYGISQNEAAENVFLELKGLIEDWMAER